MNYFLDAFRRYADFSGKSNLTEFWMFILFNILISVVLGILLAVSLLVSSLPMYAFSYVLYAIYGLVTLIPYLAIMIRRLRDAGKEWTWIFINFIPLVGPIWFIILLCQPSVEQREN